MKLHVIKSLTWRSVFRSMKIFVNHPLREKCPNTELFLVRISCIGIISVFPVFGVISGLYLLYKYWLLREKCPNTELLSCIQSEYRKINPYFDTLHAVISMYDSLVSDHRNKLNVKNQLENSKLYQHKTGSLNLHGLFMNYILKLWLLMLIFVFRSFVYYVCSCFICCYFFISIFTVVLILF